MDGVSKYCTRIFSVPQGLLERFGSRGLFAVSGLFLLLGAVILHKAWASDDAFITFRAVQNFVEGRGLTWNVGERVQVFTHPLWMMMMSAAYAVTREMFYSCVFLGVALALTTVGLLAFRLASSWQSACLGIAALTASRAFTDYSTSGLENSLTHLLLVLLVLADSPRITTASQRIRFSLLAGLCLLTRLDLLILILPTWAVFLWRTRGGGWIRDLLIGIAPLAAWEFFSLLYFGSLLPNTAFAKLNTGIPKSDMWIQGGHYLWNSLYWDPVTLSVTLLASGYAIFCALRPARGEATPKIRASSLPPQPWTWAAGIGCMLVYVTSVGGDFMSGRFLTPPLIVGVALLVTLSLPSRATLVATGALLVLLVLPWTTPLRDREYGDEWHAAIDSYGISDERNFYREIGTLRASWGKNIWPDPKGRKKARRLLAHWPKENSSNTLLESGGLQPEDRDPPGHSDRNSGGPKRKVIVRGAVGYLGYHLGPRAHILDFYGIGDPLLSRLPAHLPDPMLAALIPRIADKGWRVGHYYRSVPAGYFDTLTAGTNVIENPALASYYAVIRTITRDPIFDLKRLKLLLEFQLGAYDHLLREAEELGY